MEAFASGAFLYGVGYVAYMVAVQVMAMGLANRRLSEDEFGSFAILFSFSMFFAMMGSRWLQHLVIRTHPGGPDPGPAYWRWFHGIWVKGAALLALSAGLSVALLAPTVGIGDTIPRGVAALTGVALCFTHILFEGLVGTVARIRRRFRTLTLAFVSYAVVVTAAAWFAQAAAHFMTAFVVAGGSLTAVFVVQAARKGEVGRSKEEDLMRPTLMSALARRVALFAALSLAIRYLDRVLVGHFMGPETAGAFFALNAGVMATLMPVSMLSPLFHGWIAEWETMPGAHARRRIFLVLLVVVPLSLLVVSPLARLVVTIVYPKVVLPSLGVAWYLFCLGRVLLVSRDLSEPLISRFGNVTILPIVDGALLVGLGLSMLSFQATLSLDTVNLLSGICLGIAGCVGLAVLFTTGTTGSQRGEPA